MKKKMFNIVLNIVTIALCVCAIVIGVYSVKQAKLTTSGSIGFEVHNCIVEISGTYDAYESVDSTTRKQ